jgi:16S rRNA C1402 N4-methylase RsmH
MVAWSHAFLEPALAPGDLAIDLTAGSGCDTLFLCRCVGREGRVIAFDIQTEALDRTAARVGESGAEIYRQAGSFAPVTGLPAGVHLIQDDHRRLDAYVTDSPTGIIANLGYLPGGDPGIVTSPASTRIVLQKSCALLAPGGRIAVTVYPGHAGGAAEGGEVADFFRNLSPELWQILRIEIPNRGNAPFLLMGMKRKMGLAPSP